MRFKFEGLWTRSPGQGGSILILQLDRQSVSRLDWLANIYLIFLLEFLYFYFPLEELAAGP
jgi:hypothetical protein